MIMKMLRILCVALSALLAPAVAAMDNPGPFPLLASGGSDFSITAAATQVGTPSLGFAGVNAAAFQVRLSGGASGIKISVYIQTSLDQGQSWIDIANIAFTNTPGVAVINVSALDKLTTVTAPSDGGLADNTVLDGVLGDQFRAKVISTGTYTGGTLISVRGQAR
jgi:hypothetical protein